VGQRGHSERRELQIFYGKENENFKWKENFFVHHRIISAVKRAEFVSSRVPYIVLRGRWINIIVLKVHAPSAENMMIQKQIYKEFEQVFLFS
jgi:hypothetical protein